jgi:hypothetical protein
MTSASPCGCFGKLRRCIGSNCREIRCLTIRAEAGIARPKSAKLESPIEHAQFSATDRKRDKRHVSRFPPRIFDGRRFRTLRTGFAQKLEGVRDWPNAWYRSIHSLGRRHFWGRVIRNAARPPYITGEYRSNRCGYSVTAYVVAYHLVPERLRLALRHMCRRTVLPVYTPLGAGKW